MTCVNAYKACMYSSYTLAVQYLKVIILANFLPGVSNNAIQSGSERYFEVVS